MNNSKELCNMNRSVFHCPAIFLVGDTAVCHQLLFVTNGKTNMLYALNVAL